MAHHFTWMGLGKKAIEAQVAAMKASIKYPELRGKPMQYYDARGDTPQEAQKKEERRKEYLAMREKELREHLAKIDAEAVFGPDGPGQLRCKKGETIEVDEKHPALAKLRCLSRDDGKFGWVEKGAKAAEKPPKA